MKVAVMSDTHGKIKHLRPRDIPEDVGLLIHCGDITMLGELHMLNDLNRWFKCVPWVENKIVVPGNHDLCFRDYYGAASECLSEAQVLLDKEVVVVDGMTGNEYRVYGSPWTPKCGNDWAFWGRRGAEMEKCWRPLLEGFVKPDILVTHGPPYGILDEVDRYGDPEWVGCEHLRKAIEVAEPKLHVFGHIHEGYGQKQHGKTLCVNASILNRRYFPKNPIQIVEV